MAKKNTGNPDYKGLTTRRALTANSAIRRAGYDYDRAEALSKIMAAHSISETGWIDPKDNNYAGYMSNGKRMRFSSPDAFWDYHLNNLSIKFPGWDKSTNMKEYDEAINHSSLGLDTEDKFKAYQKTHPDTYIYAPIWENKNYLKNMSNIYDKRVVPYTESVRMPILPYRVTQPSMILKSPEPAPILSVSGFNNGGGIHIDPSKKGTFTAAASKHGKSVQAFASQVLAHKENYSPAMVKKANFARNAAKWHAEGGFLNRFSTAFDGNTAEMLAAVRKQLLNRN